MSGNRGIGSIAVAGAGVVGLSAALAFARALPNARIAVVETRPDPAALADVLPVARGAGRDFHTLIGLDEGELVRAGIATHFLGTRFDHWSASGTPWWHVSGDYGKPTGAVAFDQIWTRAKAAGKARPYDHYSVGAALARAGKFVHPARDPNFIGSRFDYGLRLDPERYRELLRERAQSVNVRFHTGDIEQVEIGESGAVAALRLHGGSRIEAELFIDCTGPAAIVIGAVENSFEDWSCWLPLAHLTIESTRGQPVAPPSDIVSANSLGWDVQWPTAGRILTGRLRSHAAEGSIHITRGRRLRPWVRNVLAIGDSATALDPLHRLNLDVSHQEILLALELLPGRDFNPIETGEYNRRAEQMGGRVRDFLALQYIRSGRTDSFWAELAAVIPPFSLSRTLDQFLYRGRLPFFEEDPISRDSWSAALLGLGVIPCQPDPAASSAPLDQTLVAMERLAKEIADVVEPLPDYPDYLGRLLVERSR